MRLRAFAALCAVSLAMLVAIAASGCSSGGAGNSATPSGASSGAATSGGATIVEKNYAFTPNTVTVNVGDTVTFKNEDSVTHEVNINNKDLGKQAPGQDVTWQATADGTYAFRCMIHASMTGQVTVGAGGGASSAPPAGGTSGGYTPPSGTGY